MLNVIWTKSWYYKYLPVTEYLQYPSQTSSASHERNRKHEGWKFRESSYLGQWNSYSKNIVFNFHQSNLFKTFRTVIIFTLERKSINIKGIAPQLKLYLHSLRIG